MKENIFEEESLEAYYWAGFIAADGCINKNGAKYRLSISLSNTDKRHLEQFVKFLGSDRQVWDRISKEGYKYSQVHIYSEKVVFDLRNKFNITPRKSLTFVPPVIDDKNLADAFILGYIDGDGSIHLTKHPKGAQEHLQISVVGTKDLIDFINKRFNEILGEGTVTRAYLKTKTGVYHTSISRKKARIIFKHFQMICVPKLDRKWGEPYKSHCENWKHSKRRCKHNVQVGQIFNDWVVIGEDRSSGKLRYTVLCKCGNVSVTSGYHLINGKSKGCGCKR